MALPAFLNFTKNIRTHATIVGVWLALNAIIVLLICAAWVFQSENLPEEVQKSIAFVKDFLLVVGIVITIFAIMFWVGFLKRQRWCLTLCIGCMAVAITLQFIGLLGAILQLNIISACVILIALAVCGYMLLVTLQLRKANSDFALPQDGFGVLTK